MISHEFNYRIYLLRPNCCSHMIKYSNEEEDIKIDVIEFDAMHKFESIRNIMTSNTDIHDDDEMIPNMHVTNCDMILSNETMMNFFKNSI